MRKSTIALILICALIVTACFAGCGKVPDELYAVEYTLGGGTGTAPVESDKSAGAKFDLAQSTGFEKEGYDFDGWSDGENKYAAGAEYTMPSHSVTFTAQWKISAPDLVLLYVGENVVLPVDNKEGWTSDDACVTVSKKANGEYIEIIAVSSGSAIVSNGSISVRTVVKDSGGGTVFEVENKNVEIDLSVSVSSKITVTGRQAEEFEYATWNETVAVVGKDGVIYGRHSGFTVITITDKASGFKGNITVSVAGERAWKKTLTTGEYGATGHLQGIATDLAGEYFYYSVTDKIVKQKADGTIAGSVASFGSGRHLGDITVNPDDGKIYASLTAKVEYGNSAQDNSQSRNCFVVIIDPKDITEENMPADEVCKVVYVGMPIAEYAAYEADGADILLGGKYGIKNSIDACAFGPKFGESGGKNYFTMVAGGASAAQLGSDGVSTPFDREDNDYFVLMQFDADKLCGYAKPYGDINKVGGPETADGTYFYYAGFHDYGAQNLCYDSYKKVWFVTSYEPDSKKPSRSEFPPYMFFVIDATYAKEETLVGNGTDIGAVLRSAYGVKDETKDVSGYAKYAGVGILSLGDGKYYVGDTLGSGANQGGKMNLYTWADDIADWCIKTV